MRPHGEQNRKHSRKTAGWGTVMGKPVTGCESLHKHKAPSRAATEELGWRNGN